MLLVVPIRCRRLVPFFFRALLLTAVLCGASAAQRQYRFDRWTTAEGLPQNSVNAVVQTQDGYLWIATFGGLARFDGVRFTVFNTVNAPALKSSRITALYEDPTGILWAATETGEIACRRDGEFQSFEAGGEAEEIFSLFADSNGYLWTGGWRGARRYRLPENRCAAGSHGFERIKPPLAGSQSSDQISTILETGDGAIWLDNFGTSDEKPGRLLRWRADQPLEVFDAADGLAAGAPNEKKPGFLISDIALAPAKNGAPETLWVADRSGLLKFDGKRFVKELFEDGDPNERFRFARDQQGNLIVNLSDRIARLDAANRWQTSAAELAGKQARVLFSDRENNLWLGTNADGLYRLQPNFINSFDESSGVARNQTAAVLEDSAGNLWIAGFGLHRFENNRFVRERHAPESYLLALHETRDKTLMIGGYDKLLARRASGSIDDLTPELKKIFADAPFAVKAIFEDSSGALWLGFRDKGALRLDANGSYKRFTTDNGLIGNQVQFIQETSGGAVWFGTSNGASRFENERFANFTIADGFANNNVRAILETRDGAVYFGTYGGGLSRLKNDRITTVTAQNGLFDDVVSRIIIDENQNFWMLGNLGVFSVNKQDVDRFLDGESAAIFCRSFGTADGMITAEGNGGSQPAGWLASDKSFWFPTIRGYVRIEPPAPAAFLPAAVIETVTVNNKIVDAQQPITINPNDQNLEIRYTGLSFNRSEQLRFRYKLEGFDRDWTEAGTRRTAYYSHPPIGEFVFSVQAANSDGVWNQEPARLRLRVLPVFYRTWWFFLLAAAVAAGFAYSIYALRVARLDRARKTQEALSRRLIQLQEEERKRIAADLHDSLSQNLVIIKNRAMISLQERDDLASVFEQIEEIAEAAGESLDEVRQIAQNLRPFQIDRLGFAKAVEALARKANGANLEIAAQIDEINGLLVPEMEINLYRIIQECLNNIVKHSGATAASIEIRRTEKAIHVRVSDNGKGFDLNDVHRTEPENGNGFGLIGIYERARILGCVPIIETSAEKGTAIRLVVSI